jgi:hypothetical protein
LFSGIGSAQGEAAVITGSGTYVPTAKQSQAGVRASFSFFRLPLSQPYPWTAAVLVDELNAGRA